MCFGVFRVDAWLPYGLGLWNANLSVHLLILAVVMQIELRSSEDSLDQEHYSMDVHKEARPEFKAVHECFENWIDLNETIELLSVPLGDQDG